MDIAKKILLRPVAELIAYANNSRTHTAKQIEKIAASIKEFGFTNPVLIDAKGTIVAGHGRVQAARKLNLTEVPTIEVDWLTDDQKRAYIIADNRLAEDAGWDKDLLRVELSELKRVDFELTLTGFNGPQIAALLDDALPLPGDSAAPPRSVCQPGEVWVLGNHRLLVGGDGAAQDADSAVRGWQQKSGEDAILEGDGVAFDDVAADRMPKRKVKR
jgi:hypothetical protein